MTDTKGYEYRTVTRLAGRGPRVSDPTTDADAARRRYLEYRRILGVLGGGTIEIHRRPVGEWETVEREEFPG
jgi:hypothetical protein